jgi:hypothetical protein
MLLVIIKTATFLYLSNARTEWISRLAHPWLSGLSPSSSSWVLLHVFMSVCRYPANAVGYWTLLVKISGTSSITWLASSSAWPPRGSSCFSCSLSCLSCRHRRPTTPPWTSSPRRAKMRWFPRPASSVSSVGADTNRVVIRWQGECATCLHGGGGGGGADTNCAVVHQ